MKNHQATDEIYEPDPDLIEICWCGVCNDEMEVERNRRPSNSFAGAICGHNRYYDKFTCPNRNLKWHIQARNLKKAIRETPSKTIADLMKEELDNILDNRVATK